MLTASSTEPQTALSGMCRDRAASTIQAHERGCSARRRIAVGVTHKFNALLKSIDGAQATPWVWPTQRQKVASVASTDGQLETPLCAPSAAARRPDAAAGPSDQDSRADQGGLAQPLGQQGRPIGGSKVDMMEQMVKMSAQERAARADRLKQELSWTEQAIQSRMLYVQSTVARREPPPP